MIESRGTFPQSQIDVFRILHVQDIYKYQGDIHLFIQALIIMFAKLNLQTVEF